MLIGHLVFIQQCSIKVHDSLPTHHKSETIVCYEKMGTLYYSMPEYLHENHSILMIAEDFLLTPLFSGVI